jgi:uncharacterized protein YecE (DUF72 family)
VCRGQRDHGDACRNHGGLRVFPPARRGYTPDDIGRWAQTIRERTAGCSEVFVYFKHEEAGKGPEFARQLLDALGLP